MEKLQAEKSASFTCGEDKSSDSPRPPSNPDSQEEQTNDDEEVDEKEVEQAEEPKELGFNVDYQRISEEIDEFLHNLVNLEEKEDDTVSDAGPEKKDNPENEKKDDPESNDTQPEKKDEAESNDAPKKKEDPKSCASPTLPDSIEKLLKMVESEIAKYDVPKEFGKWSRECSEDEASVLLEAVDKASKLVEALGMFPSQPTCVVAVHRTSSLVHRAMQFIEEEFRCLLEDSSSEVDAGPVDLKKRQMSMSTNQEPDRCTPGESDADANFPNYTPEAVSRMGLITKAMIAGGYETECRMAFTTARRNAFIDNLSKFGFERISIDDIQKMQWDALEMEIVTWMKACRRCTAMLLPGEKKFSECVFSHHPSIATSIYIDLACGVMGHLLNFSEAVSITKRSAEKLFKLLDIYETLRDLGQTMDGDLFPEDSLSELKTEASAAQCRMGILAISIFVDLENSIKSDNGKTPVPGGAVHPLTRYVMNYVKYACEYKDTLEQVFLEHLKVEKPDDSGGEDGDGGSNASRHSKEESTQPSPFSVQLMAVMDLLDSNLEGKSKLYRDISLSYIFLMNNGRYIMQKIKGSTEIHDLLGPTWCRKRSSDLRQYHKNYQRETWGKVLACLRDEGLMQGKGSIVKPALKERFKTFNAVFEEIHKTQSMWVVSDEQLQSELRVSISAVVIPAYRSFLGRFQQYLDPGRQTEKYIKYGPEELEACVDELFDGTPTSIVRRR